MGAPPARDEAVWYRFRPGGELRFAPCAKGGALAAGDVLGAARAHCAGSPELCARRAGGTRDLLAPTAQLRAGSEVLVRAVARTLEIRPDLDGRAFSIGTFAAAHGGCPDFQAAAETKPKAGGAWSARRTAPPDVRAGAGAGAAALPRAGVRLSRAGGEELQGDPETQNSHYYALVADDGGVAGESAANEGVAAASAVGVADWYSFKKVSDARELLTTEDAEALMAARNKKSYQRWMLKNEGIKAALEDGEGAGAGGGGGGAADAADAAMGFGGAAAVKQGKTNREVLDELNEAGEGEGEGEDKGEAWEHEDAATDDDEAAAAGSEDEEEPEEKDPLRRKKAKAEAAEDGEGNELNVAGQMFATLLARADQDEDGSGSDSEDDSDEEPFVDPDEDPDAGGLFDRMAKKAAGDEGGGAGGSGGTKRGRADDADAGDDVKRVKLEEGGDAGGGAVTAGQLKAVLRKHGGLPTRALLKHFKGSIDTDAQKQAFRALLKAHTRVVERDGKKVVVLKS